VGHVLLIIICLNSFKFLFVFEDIFIRIRGCGLRSLANFCFSNQVAKQGTSNLMKEEKKEWHVGHVQNGIWIDSDRSIQEDFGSE